MHHTSSAIPTPIGSRPMSFASGMKPPQQQQPGSSMTLGDPLKHNGAPNGGADRCASALDSATTNVASTASGINRVVPGSGISTTTGDASNSGGLGSLDMNRMRQLWEDEPGASPSALAIHQTLTRASANALNTYNQRLAPSNNRHTDSSNIWGDFAWM